jgi:hypothetical protein
MNNNTIFYTNITNYTFTCFTLREEHRLRVYENRVLRRIVGPKGEEVAGGWTKLKVKSFATCTPHQIFLG